MNAIINILGKDSLIEKHVLQFLASKIWYHSVKYIESLFPDVLDLNFNRLTWYICECDAPYTQFEF